MSAPRYNPPPNPYLSGREKEIILHTAQGHAAKWIASHLHISMHTVKKHRFNAYTKLGVSNAPMAVAAAIFQGYLTEEEWLT